MHRKFRHQRGFGHAGLRVDFETDETSSPFNSVIPAKVGAADPPASEGTMSRKRQSSDLLVNKW